MPYDIIILGGQSNAEGNGLGPTDRPYIPDERILIMRDGGKYGYEEQPDGKMKFIITEPFTFVTDTAKERNDGTQSCGMFALAFAKKYVESGLLDEGRKLLITSVVDNLLKGASGQAVQNMNLMFGLDEMEGLRLKASYF